MDTEPSVKVILGVPHALLREGLRDVLKRWSGIRVLAASPSAAEAARRAERLDPDALIMSRSGAPAEDARAVTSVREQMPHCRIVLVDDIRQASRGGDLGADWRVPASVGPAGLVKGLWELCRAKAGEPRAAPSRQSAEGASAEPRQLMTGREYEVLCAICEGLPNRAIAQRLGISEKTVKNHLSSIYRRAKVRTRTQLVLWAMERGLGAGRPQSET